MTKRRPKSTELTTRQKACFGPKTAKAPGSTDWCYQSLESLKYQWEEKQLVDRQWAEALAELKQQKVWETFPPDKPYGSFEEMLKQELGVEEAGQ